MRLSFAACLLLFAASSCTTEAKRHHPTISPTPMPHHHHGHHNNPVTPPPTQHAGHHGGTHTPPPAVADGAGSLVPVPPPTEAPRTEEPAPKPTVDLAEKEQEEMESAHQASSIAGGGQGQQTPDTGADLEGEVADLEEQNQELEDQVAAWEAETGDGTEEDGSDANENAQSATQQELDQLKQEAEYAAHVGEEEAKEDWNTAEQEIKDFVNETENGQFGAWYNNQKEIPVYPEDTLAPMVCEDQMAAQVQTYWDLLYTMIFFALLTIIVPYLSSCFMSKHSFQIMRFVAGVHYFSGALKVICGLLLSTALLPNCPVECGEFFCDLHEYNPGPLYGVIVFFVGVLWLLKAMMLSCRAGRVEREYLYQMHIKNGGTATSEVALTTEEQNEIHMRAASRRTKPKVRPEFRDATNELI